MTTEEKEMKVANHYGFDHQLIKLAEECGELIVAIAKYINSGCTSEAFENLKEELADVNIVSNQIIRLISKPKIDEIIEYKLDRQLKRMAEGE